MSLCYDTVMKPIFKDYLHSIEDLEMRQKMQAVLDFCCSNYPNLQPKIAWNQPMFTDHGTYIIGFSVAKDHLVVGLELKTMNHFVDLIKAQGFTAKKMTFQIKRHQAIPETLLKTILDETIVLKQDINTFWF